MMLRLVLLLVVSMLCSSIIYFIPYYIKNYFCKRKFIVLRNVKNILERGVGMFPRTSFEELLLSLNGLSNKIYGIYELYWKNNLNHIVKLSIICYYLSSILIQKIFQIKFINLVSLSFIDIFSFTVGILGMYGIYIGFLQYATESNERGKYLGKNKTSYLLKDFFWYHFSQSKGFVFSLFVTIIVPIIIKLSLPFSKVNLYLIYSWQSAVFLLLIAFIFLLRMSLFLIGIMSAINSGVDYNLRSAIQERIKKEYVQKFWAEFKKELRSEKFNNINRKYTFTDHLLYKIRFWRDHQYMKQQLLCDDLEPNFLYKWLNYDINNLSETEKQEYVELVFAGIQKDVYDKVVDNDNLIVNNLKKFHQFYKFFVEAKWKLFVPDNDKFRFASKKQEGVDVVMPFESWYILLNYEIEIFNLLLEKLDGKKLLENYYINKSSVYQGVNNEVRYNWSFSDETAESFLWNMILKYPKPDMQKIYNDLIISTKEWMCNITSNKVIVKKIGKAKGLKYRYNNLEKKVIEQGIKSYIRYSNYKFYRISFETFKWYQFWKKDNLFLKDIDYTQNNLYEMNSAFNKYSEILFESLGHSRDKFVQHQKSCILSMNNEYKLAFMFYQLFYTDNIEWDDNLDFYDTEIRKLMRCDVEKRRYLFKQASKIILQTNISHRITNEFLNRLWKTRNNIIRDFYWFNQFGTRHQMSELKILYIQWLLSGKQATFSSRFNFKREFPIKMSGSLVEKIRKENDLEKVVINSESLKGRLIRKKERVGSFCREYLVLTDKLESIFTKKAYSYRENDIQLSIEYLLYSGKVSVSDVIDNISVTSLLRLEWILKYGHFSQETNYNSRTFFDALASDNSSYWSIEEGMLEFYILKIIDTFYQNLYKDIEFIERLKNSLIYTLNLHDETVEEYVELVSKKVSNIVKISILQKGKIISKLNDILSRQQLKRRRRYHHYR